MLSPLTERRRIEELVSRNLKGGRVDLTVRTKDGLTYIVSRSPDDEPIVKTAEGKVTDLSVSGGGLFRISVFSQNEVEQIADRTASQLDLLDLFEPERINEFGRQMEASRHQLELNASQMKPLRERLAQMGEEVKGGEAVDERLGAFGAEGGDSADTINQAHALKSLRDRETRALKGAKDLVSEVGKSMKAMVGSMSARGHRVVTDEMRQGPNSALLDDLASELADTANGIDRHIEAALSRLNDCWQRVSTIDGHVAQTHREQEVVFQQLMENHKEAQEKASERSRLEKLRNELQAKAAELIQVQEQVKILEEERQQVMDHLSIAEALEVQAANPVPDPKVLRRQVPRLVDRLHLMRDLLEDMRDFSQATPRERTPELLAGIVTEALKLVEEWFAARHLDLSPIRFEIVVPDTIILPVCRLPMLMAIRNLLKNAVESLAIGPTTFRAGQVRLRTAVVEEWVVIEIADTGAGLSAEELAEIEEFVPGRCSRKAHGTGFGLPIAYRKVSDHGGNLAIASALDEGTTITVTLPLVLHEDDRYVDCAAPATRSERPDRR